MGTSNRHDIPSVDIAMLDSTSKPSGSNLLYPSSSPSINPEDCSSPTLRASIAAVSDSKLRAIMIKLAESSPQFHRSVMKELGYPQASEEPSPTSPTSPTTPTARRPEKRRSKPTHHKTLTISTQTPIHNPKRHISTATKISSQSDCVYHPGSLKEEDYEFLSGTGSPDDIAHRMVRTLTMWSCCDEDEWNPGCMKAIMIPSQLKVEHDERYDANLSCDDVFPDSDLEERPDSLDSRSLSQTK